jgi:hypothetical protein
MKKMILFALLGVLIAQPVFSQSKVTEKFILGQWKLVIDIEDELREAEEEAKETESLIAEIITNSVTGAVSGILKRVDIQIDFREGGEAKVVINVFDEREVEYASWEIDKYGRLHIEDIDDFKTDEGDYWLRDGDILLLTEDDDQNEKNVYMTKVEN